MIGTHSLDAGPAVVVVVPDGQESQVLAPSAEISPTGQSWHSVAADSPSGWNPPAGQEEQPFPSTN